MFKSCAYQPFNSFVMGACERMLVIGFVLGNALAVGSAQSRFVHVPSYPAGGSFPTLLAQHDVNRDGKLDLIVMNSNKATQLETVSLLLGNGMGGYEAPKTMAYLPVSYGKPLVADVNRDGQLDLIFYVASTHLTRVYLGQGEGFQQYAVVSKEGPCPYPVTCHASEMHVADFNGDGNPDLLTLLVDEDRNQALYLTLGNGNGTFRSPRALDVSGSLTIGDFNGDKLLDIAVVGDYGFQVLLGNGDGTFRQGVSQSVPTIVGQLISADLRGNGKTDLILITSLTAEQSGGECRGGDVAVMLGNGDGTFAPTASYYPTGDWTQDAVLADMSGDHRPDLVVTNQLSGSYSVLLNAGSGKFATAVNYRSPESLAGDFVVGDLNGDGRPDLTISTGKGVEVLRNTGAGQLYAPVSVAHFHQYYPALTYAADMNHDGIPDLVGFARPSFAYDGCYDPAQQNDFVITSQKGQPLANVNGNLMTPFYYMSDIGLGDFDHDGSLEILSTGRDKNDGATQLAVQRVDGSIIQPIFTVDGYGGSGAASVGDFNRDGYADVALANDGTQILLGDGKGSFTFGRVYSPGFEPFATRDLNGDGKLDLILNGSGGIQILLGNGNGTFQTPKPYAIVEGPNYLAIADFNGDGKPDLAIAGGSEVSLLLNNGNGTFKNAVNYPTGGPVSAIAAISLAGDGKPGVLIADSKDNKLVLLVGDGKGNLGAPVYYYPGGGAPQGLTVADFNGDGAPDVAVADETTSSYMVLYNTGGTSLKLAASIAKPIAGQRVTFTATVSASIAGSGTPSGTLAFKENSTTLGTVSLSGGKATFSTAALTRGTHTIKGSYFGNSSFNPHLSTGLTITVQ